MVRYLILKKEVFYDVTRRPQWSCYTHETKADKEKMSIFGVKDTKRGMEYTCYLVTDLDLKLIRKKLIPIILSSTGKIDDYIYDKMPLYKDREELRKVVEIGIKNKEYRNEFDKPY